MPSATESMIAAQAMGKMYEVTPPENPSAELGGRNNRFNYARPEQKTYNGKTAIIDSVLADVKYAGEKAAARYNLSRDDDKGPELYQKMIRNVVSANPDMSLYESLMFGYSRN